MKIYEGMFLCDSRKANRDWDAVASHVQGILDKCGASTRSLTKWAERKLAYPVEKHTRGVYVLTYFEAPEESEELVTEVYRQVEISDTILRAMIIRVKALPPTEEGETEPAGEAAEAAAPDAPAAEPGSAAQPPEAAPVESAAETVPEATETSADA